MNNHDLERLASLCIIIDHLEQHAKFTESEPFIREREALIAAPTPKPAQQAQAKRK